MEHSSPTVSPIPHARGPSVFKLCVKLLPPVINRRNRVRVLRTDQERTRTSLYQEPEHLAFGINGTASNALPAFLPTPPPQQPVMTSCTIPIIYMETNGGYGMGMETNLWEWSGDADKKLSPCSSLLHTPSQGSSLLPSSHCQHQDHRRLPDMRSLSDSDAQGTANGVSSTFQAVGTRRRRHFHFQASC